MTQEARMKSEKAYFMKSILFMLTLLIFLPGIQGIKQEATSYSGIIESIDKEFRFIVVNGAKILISGDTGIVDGKGNRLKMDDLKPNLSATIEGVRGPDGFWAKRIVVTPPKKK
jgi:hypothetical protein